MQKRVSSKSRQSGYTLIEILIVVAILAAVSALAVPALRGPLERTRLRSAARNVQSAIGKARNAAIRTGRIHTIEYEPGSGRMRLDRSPEPTMADFETGGATSAIPDSVDELLDPTQTDVSAVEMELPTGVYFARTRFERDPDNGDIFDTVSGSEMPISAATAESDVLIEPADRPEWSRPIIFHPNGRTEDITIRVATQSAFVDVSIRGLTGTASFSRPRRWPINSDNDLERPASAVSSTDNPAASTRMRP